VREREKGERERERKRTNLVVGQLCNLCSCSE
jgi:hypothetical protein